MGEQWSWEMVGANRVEWTLPNTSKGESLVTTHPSDPLGIVGPKMFSRQAPKVYLIADTLGRKSS